MHRSKNDQLDLDGLLDRQISRFVTFEAEFPGVVAPVCEMPDDQVVLFGRH